MVAALVCFVLAMPGKHAAAQTADTLSLEEVLAAVETGYPKLAGADAERQVAAGKLQSKRGAFDPVTFAGTEFLRYNSSSSRGKQQTATVNSAGVEYLTRSGVKVATGVNLNAGTVKSPLSSTGGTGEYFTSVKIPLQRGRGLNEKSAAERQAELGVPLADQNFAATRLNALLAAATAYWDWAAAGRKLAVARDLLEVAEKRAAFVAATVEKGAVPRIDSVEARQEVERRRGALVKAERDVEKAAFKLGLYLWGPDGEPGAVPSAASVPATLPEPADLDDAEIEEARARAAAFRPELRSVELTQRSVRIDRDLARNDERPGVDLVYSPGVDTGLNGVGSTLKTGVLFSVPLNRWEATGRRREAEAKLRKLEQEQALLARQVRLEVDDAASAVRAAEGRYQAARREVQLAEELEAGERKRFELGEGTLFLLNQRERATAEARSRLIEVQAEYQQTLAAFRAAGARL
jgi:outer membrane protein TolC